MEKGKIKKLITPGIIEWQGEAIPYQVCRGKRKTVAVHVDRDGQVTVRLPADLPISLGHGFAEKNSGWIFEHRRAVLETAEKKRQISWTSGLRLEIEGKPAILKVEVDECRGRGTAILRGNADTLFVTVPTADGEAVKSLCLKWYKEYAACRLRELTAEWAEKMLITYGKISIRNQVTRWGSCSASGNLNFNWKLVLLPVELAEYVVVHELAHRKEMNHSGRFWKVVEEQLPDFQQRRKRLKGYESEINTKY